MTIDTMTIVLDGDVPLHEFARAIERFNELVQALTDEVGTPALDWILDDLQVSSAVATVRGLNDPTSAERVVEAYAEIGDALAHRKPVKYSARVRSAGQNIVAIEDARVKAVRFETPVREVTVKTIPGQVIEFPVPGRIGQETTGFIEELTAEAVARPEPIALAPRPAYGGIQGRVQALSNRGGLRFTLYDLLYDKAVSCYIREGTEDLLRDIWGKMAVVEGMITRDPVTGRPLAIRQIERVIPLPEPYDTKEYLGARGAAPSLTRVSPEEAIRRIRDAQ